MLDMGYRWIPAPDCKIQHAYGEEKWRPSGVNKPHEHYVWNPKENGLLKSVDGDKEVLDAIAATLQARLSWPQADACAIDIMMMFERKNWVVTRS